jgi:hypothetical protein
LRPGNESRKVYGSSAGTIQFLFGSLELGVIALVLTGRLRSENGSEREPSRVWIIVSWGGKNTDTPFEICKQGGGTVQEVDESYTSAAASALICTPSLVHL